MQASRNKRLDLRAIVVARQSDDTKGTAATVAQLDHVEKSWQLPASS
jgi:hypothetical protein